jgi:O-antigen/teichoic acid export membrane protein
MSPLAPDPVLADGEDVSPQAPSGAALVPAQGQPSVRRTVARNVAWNWVGTASHMVCGFVTVPYLLHYLGQMGYSLWTLIASLTGYFDLLDLGLRNSLGRNIAFHQASGDREKVTAVFNTGLTLLSAGSVLVLLGTGAVLLVFTSLFEVPTGQVVETRIALVLIGLNLALIFPFFAFEAVLWAHQRFDLINCIEIPGVLLRTALTFMLVTGQNGLVTLALITLGVTLVGGSAKVVLARRLDPELCLRPGFVSREAAGGLYRFGVWCVLVQVARVVTCRAGEPIIANRVALALVAPFSIAARLVAYANNVMVSATGVLTPLATTLHARGKLSQQQLLFVQGGKCCLALGLFFLGLFAFLGQPLLVLWTHGSLAWAWPVLMILALGEVLPMSQWVTFSMVLGMSRHRLWACMGLVEAAAAISLALTVGQAHGLVGVAVALAIPGVICRGLVPMVYACRLLRVPLWRYAVQALLPAAAAAAPAVLCLTLLTRWQVPESWPALFADGIAASLCFLAGGAVAVLGLEGLRAGRSEIRRRYVRGGTPEAVRQPQRCEEA